MKKPLRFSFVQLNPTVGDLAGNANKILQYSLEAKNKNCDLAIFPELSLTGYPPEDLILKPAFIADNLAALHRMAARMKSMKALVGFINQDKGKIYNAAAFIENNQVKSVYHKQCLPNYGVFDENRYFVPGNQPVVLHIKGSRLGVTICEDIWVDGSHLKKLKTRKPDLILNISASPFHAGKLQQRRAILKNNIKKLGSPLLYCNMVGGQDELVFDGGSFVLSPQNTIDVQAPLFTEGSYVFTAIPSKKKSWSYELEWPSPKEGTRLQEIHDALVLGIRDYLSKNGFSKVTLGVSGGIDSAVVAALAVEALGPENVVCVTMPSQFNSDETVNDARSLAHNLGTKLMEIPIQSIYGNYLTALEKPFQHTSPNEAEENIQARIRGTLLMALSNKFGWLVLTTGNKSELSTGYCTLYGDTAGGFSVLKDVLKTTVFQLATYINEKANRELIPVTTITRPPTAELRAHQKDEDSLGAYKDLDPIIVSYIEENKSLQMISKMNVGRADYVAKTLARIDRNEYKRRQAPPGIKITPRSFGKDHRMPITNRYNPT